MGRIENILALAAAEKISTFKGFEEIEEAAYLLHSDLPDGYRIQLRYELSDVFLTIEITCIFGYFESITGELLLTLLKRNYGSFEHSCAYLATVVNNDTLYISLQTSQVFLPKWSDEDIAQALAIKLFHLMSALLMPGLPVPIKIFGM